MESQQELSLSAYLGAIHEIIAVNLGSRYEWITGEISEIRNYRGHYFLTIVEYDESGQLIAKISAKIWATTAKIILEKYKKETGISLAAGIKILMQAKADFHPQYGLALTITNIDPNYTLGEMKAKLKKIREKLIKNKLFNKNKLLPVPEDFTKVAVISPNKAAGLGDFSKEADLLAKYNLCYFDYYIATFQGLDAPKSLQKELDKIINSEKNYDAVVIIRGGGAVSDLDWLNDYELAESICNCPYYVMTGVGHERDSTILDEIAASSFDTPSKVINNIFNKISFNAKKAMSDYDEICMTARKEISNGYILIESQFSQIKLLATQIIKNTKQLCKTLITEILSYSPKNILDRGYVIVTNKVGKMLRTKKSTQLEGKLILEFKDGKLEVLNKG